MKGNEKGKRELEWGACARAGESKLETFFSFVHCVWAKIIIIGSSVNILLRCVLCCMSTHTDIRTVVQSSTVAVAVELL